MLLPADASSASTAPASVPAQERHRRVADSDRPALVIALPPRVTVTSRWAAPRAVRRASAKRPVRPAAVASHARGPLARVAVMRRPRSRRTGGCSGRASGIGRPPALLLGLFARSGLRLGASTRTVGGRAVWRKGPLLRWSADPLRAAGNWNYVRPGRAEPLRVPARAPTVPPRASSDVPRRLWAPWPR